MLLVQNILGKDFTRGPALQIRELCSILHLLDHDTRRLMLEGICLKKSTTTYKQKFTSHGAIYWKDWLSII